MVQVARNIVLSKWPEVAEFNQKQFDEWVLSLSKNDEDELIRKTVNVLFKKDFNDYEQVDDFIENMTIEQLSKLNKEKAFFNGIGPHSFYFNESGGRCLLVDNKTLYEYDKNEFDNKEIVIKNVSGENYIKEQYNGLALFFDWTRAVVDDQLVYMTIASLASYIFSSIEDSVETFIDNVYPYEFQEGQNHNAVTDNGYYVWDMQIDAGGKEKHLEELRRRIYNETLNNDYLIYLKQKCEQQNFQSTWIDRHDDEDGISKYFTVVVSDINVAKTIHLNDFYNDVLKYEQQDWSQVNELLSVEKENALKKVRDLYNDVEKNFDPKVIDFQKTIKK